ncbi:MAG: ABC transporter transmembrane domain-containing protein, partial [Aggregatilineales bacterium]
MLRRRNRSNAKDKTKNEREVPDSPMQWRRMIGYLAPYRLRLVIALIAVALSAGLGLVFPAVIQNVVDTVLLEGDIALLDTITVFLLGIFFLRSITSLIDTYNLNFIGERIVLDIRKELYSHLQSLSLSFFVERRVGELVSRISSDVTVMRSVLTNNVSNLLQQTLTLVGAIVIMFIINPRLSLFILVLIPFVVVIGFVFGFYLRRISTEVQDEIAASTVVAEEVLQNIREVKSFVREPYEVTRYEGALDRAFKAALKLLRVRVVFGPTIAFMGFGGLALILWFGGREVIDGRLTGGELIAFLIYGLTVAGS